MITSMMFSTPIEAIRSTYADLDGWHERGQRMPPEQPERGSELAQDDSHFPWHSISEVSRLSLLTGGEHLRLARTSIEAQQVFPSAHFTVLRGALVGAAQAVWILGPDDPDERQERGFTLISEMYDELRKSYIETARTTLSLQERQALQGQIVWCDARRAEVTSLRRGRRKLNQTEMIGWALDHRFSDSERRESGRLLWRQMSADAHALGWSMFQRSEVVVHDHRTGLGVLEAGGDLLRIAQPFAAAHELLKEGWSLFDRRCEGL